jgi:diguanylate cyclase (GGDEF)-like protein
LVTALVVVCSVLAALFVHSWLQNRNIPANSLWTLAFLCCAAAATCVGLRDALAGNWALDIANTFRMAAFGLAWQGARAFSKRQGNWLVAAVPAVIWVVIAMTVLPAEAVRARVLVSAPLSTISALAIAWELGRAPRRTGLVSLAAILVALHGIFFAARFVLVLLIPNVVTAAGVGIAAPLHPVVLVETLGAAVAVAFVLLSLTKEAIGEQHRDAAMLDPLTGISNRRGFTDAVAEMLARGRRTSAWTTLILIDLDQFKAINDSWGHPAGDRLLKALTDATRRFLGAGEVMGRLGGDEFAVALCERRLDEAVVLAERVRRAVATMRVDGPGGGIGFTVSLGVASLRGAHSLDQLLGAADAALYRAKAAGGNCVAFTPERRPPDERQMPGSSAIRRVA